MTPREHEDGMRHEPTLSVGEKADGFAAVMQRLQRHSPDERARLETQAEAVALGHEAYALGQEYLDRGDFEAARRWLRVAAGHHIPGAARALEEIALRQPFDAFIDFIDGATAGGDHATAGTVPCETIPSPLRPRAKDGQHRLGGLAAWTSSVEQHYIDQAVAAARQHAGRIAAQARREADAILAEARQQAERTAAACAEIVLDTEQEHAETAALLAEARQKAEGLHSACAEMMLKAKQDRREAAELLAKARQLSESVQSEAVEVDGKARRRAHETLTKAREQALLIIDDARKGASQIRRRAPRPVDGPDAAHAQSRRDLHRRLEEAVKLAGCLRTPAGHSGDGMSPGLVERSARKLPVPLWPGYNAFAGAVVLLVEGEAHSGIAHWMRVSHERDGQCCAGPGSRSEWPGIELITADGFEEAGRACGDIMVVRQDGAAILAIGVMNTGGDGDGGAECDVDGVRNPASR